MLGMSLRAVNSDDNLRFEIWYDETNKDFPATILGIFDGKDIQIDFNALSAEEMQELISFLQLRLKQAMKVNPSLGQQVIREPLPTAVDNFHLYEDGSFSLDFSKTKGQ